eukprot:CAMPEP_0177717642 /NCGR_PEP_ID=MMETSP0484_2-20121128/15154_1 /TAXON_ID=354590 /ORGANISM="Rhodomonas lens, Strain RHODO" /LENGTH=230 /DNA_ID=CAMNT_0019229757 /DNA_START=27 /DNA_END=716 /DNA_ORIENTATION=+
MRPPLALVFFRTAIPACNLALLGMVLVLVMRGKAVLAATVFVITCLCDALISAIAAIALLYTAPLNMSFVPWVSLGFSATAFLMLSLRQRTGMIAVFLFAFSVPVGVLIDVTLISKTGTFWTDVPYVTVVMTFVGLRWVGYYRSLLTMATQNIAADKAKYNEAWEKFKERVAYAGSGEGEALDGVNKLLRAMRDEIAAKHGADRPLHRVSYQIAAPPHPHHQHQQQQQQQ